MLTPRWLAVLVLVVAGLGLRPTAARAQTDSTGTAPADTLATLPVTPVAGGAVGLPSPEFETYNVSGQGLRYTASLTGLYTTGSVERTFISTAHTANFSFDGGRWLLPAGLTFSYGKQDAALKERELQLLLTPAYQRGRWRGYTLGEVERSNLRAIDRRLVGGLGLGYRFYADTLRNEASLSYLLLYEDARYLTGLHRQVPRHSLRVKARFSWGPATLNGLLYYQPAVRAPNADYRLNGTVALLLRLSAHLALSTTYAYSFESISVAGRQPTNTNLSAGFTYATGK
jgi:hypothetical protein